MDKKRQKGSVIIYALMTIFLVGLLITSLSQGPKKNASSVQLDKLTLFLQQDIKSVHTAISECFQMYPASIDVDGSGVIDATDNPNAPFPLYCADATCALSGLTSDGVSGTTGTPIANIGCPGAPDGQRVIFNRNVGNNFKLLGDTTTYTAKYFTDGTEGVYLRITRVDSDDLWEESISRLNGKYSACSAAAITGAAPCANGCFYYWIVRRASDALGGESAQPVCTPL
ncbi:MAG: hypothetical protein KAI61_02680 [Alphaproteobacteria bacterium]|nr:hypothetical protein [Alphaproteobacteria bacterium]MCK5518296.1 hypothetical protein [Alphaproteobacteria bacterium]MCK5556361.1 hypothetical protein [Alphaproteobacteria bacterium]MCK5659060.1 hypothetical protein [Alphaproteobacteria bacterium]